MTGLSKGYAFVEYKHRRTAREVYERANNKVIDGRKVLIDYELGRTLDGWKPRRLGGGFGGKKESGQLRFGCRDRPWRRPITLRTSDEGVAHSSKSLDFRDKSSESHKHRSELKDSHSRSSSSKHSHRHKYHK